MAGNFSRGIFLFNAIGIEYYRSQIDKTSLDLENRGV
jgi:hypothetical protein